MEGGQRRSGDGQLYWLSFIRHRGNFLARCDPRTPRSPRPSGTVPRRGRCDCPPSGETLPRPQGWRRASRLDAHEAFIVGLIGERKDITLKEMVERLWVERSVQISRYSVSASFTNRPVSLRVYPERIVVATEGQIICEHSRVIDRSHARPGQTIYYWRHYLAVVQRGPGAVRNGAPLSSFLMPSGHQSSITATSFRPETTVACCRFFGHQVKLT